MASALIGGLTWPDYAVLFGALACLLVIGGAFTREQRDTSDFFLARRRIPWWAACLSFLATEISAVTIISVPATAYSENWEYGQFFVGSTLAKFAVALIFIPAFYRFNCTTIYEFLEFRFGRASQVTATIFFFVTRLLGSGVRLMAACVAVSVLVGWLAAMLGEAARAGRLNVINWGPAPGDPDFWRRVLTDPNIVWLAVLNGLVGSTAAFGTDYDLMQRLLTVATRGESQRTLSLTPIGTLATLLIYLGIGAGLYTYYAQHPGQALPRADEIFPFFIRTAMPQVLRGLMLSAIVLASIDSPLGSLAASFVTDVYRPLFVPDRSDRHYLLVSR